MDGVRRTRRFHRVSQRGFGKPPSCEPGCELRGRVPGFCAVALAYRQAPETGQGYSHYYWGIDDVTVMSNPVANDLEITQVTNGNVFTVWEYRMTPFDQAIDAADGGLVAGVMYENVGMETQYEVNVVVEILDEDSTPIFVTVETLDTVYSSTQAPTCPANTRDTLYVQTGWEPAAPGSYSLRISLMNADDATPLNNVLAKDFSIPRTCMAMTTKLPWTRQN